MAGQTECFQRQNRSAVTHPRTATLEVALFGYLAMITIPLLWSIGRRVTVLLVALVLLLVGAFIVRVWRRRRHRPPDTTTSSDVSPRDSDSSFENHKRDRVKRKAMKFDAATARHLSGMFETVANTNRLNNIVTTSATT
ncbi:hypothetical protein J6590_097192 [Homalodisca vitripennis]|nr:hypothetical protein J6590_097192 [Homalodisca vitripennis]